MLTLILYSLPINEVELQQTLVSMWDRRLTLLPPLSRSCDRRCHQRGQRLKVCIGRENGNVGCAMYSQDFSRLCVSVRLALLRTMLVICFSRLDQAMLPCRCRRKKMSRLRGKQRQQRAAHERAWPCVRAL